MVRKVADLDSTAGGASEWRNCDVTRSGNVAAACCRSLVSLKNSLESSLCMYIVHSHFIRGDISDKVIRCVGSQ